MGREIESRQGIVGYKIASPAAMLSHLPTARGPTSATTITAAAKGSDAVNFILFWRLRLRLKSVN
jgi:hypothetical protein